MNSIKSFIFLILAWCAGIIFTLIFFELVLRTVGTNSPWDKTTKLNIIRNTEMNYSLNNLYPSKKKKIKYVRNKFGLRDNCENPEEIKILTIGGSTTDQRYIEFEETFQSVLQNLLSQSFNEKICVSNAGVDGHSTYGHIESIKSWFPLIAGMKPKIILMYIGINDANFTRVGVNKGYDTVNDSGIKGLMKKLELIKTLLPLYRIAKDKLQNKNVKYAQHQNKIYKISDYETTKLNPTTIKKAKDNAELFEKRIKVILSNIEKQYGAITICVTQPHKYVKKINGEKKGIKNIFGKEYSGLDFDYSLNLLNEIIFDLCQEDRTIDLYNMAFDDKHFYDGIHTTPEGSNLIGKLIHNELLKKEITILELKP